MKSVSYDTSVTFIERKQIEISTELQNCKDKFYCILALRLINQEVGSRNTKPDKDHESMDYKESAIVILCFDIFDFLGAWNSLLFGNWWNSCRDGILDRWLWARFGLRIPILVFLLRNR